MYNYEKGKEFEPDFHDDIRISKDCEIEIISEYAMQAQRIFTDVWC